MIFKLFGFSFSSFFFSLILISPLYSQIDWRINSEVGIFRSSGAGILKEKGFLSRLDGFLKYKYEEDKRNASLSLRVRPEFYSLDQPFNSIKLKAEGYYYQFEETFNWGLNVTRQKFFFNDNFFDLNYDVFTLIGDASGFSIGDLILNASAGYAYQVIKGEGEYNLDLLFADLKLFNPLSSDIKFGYGLYLERFFIRNEIHQQNLLTMYKNNGFRFGPQVSINYIRDFILNIDYRFLFHESGFTEYFSYEHWIRIVAGKIFFTDWSAFLLADYNSFFFRKAENYIEGVTPLYTPLNLENRIYLKIAYELNEVFELYTKGGFFKDNLYEDKFSLEGWNAMIGVELSGGM